MGERAIPTWIDTDAVDSNLAVCVAATPRVVAIDGGQVLDEEGDEGDECPDNCEYWDIDTGLPCFACWMAGFDAPNPDAGGE